MVGDVSPSGRGWAVIGDGTPIGRGLDTQWQGMGHPVVDPVIGDG